MKLVKCSIGNCFFCSHQDDDNVACVGHRCLSLKQSLNYTNEEVTYSKSNLEELLNR